MSAEIAEKTCNKKRSILPTPRIERSFRKYFAGKRVSAGTSVYATAALEAIFFEIVSAAEEKRISFKGKAKRIDRRMLISAVRTNINLARLFRNYAFAPESSIKIKKDALLTKTDKETNLKKRNEAKAEKIEKEAVPQVDED